MPGVSLAAAVKINHVRGNKQGVAADTIGVHAAVRLPVGEQGRCQVGVVPENTCHAGPAIGIEVVVIGGVKHVRVFDCQAGCGVFGRDDIVDQAGGSVTSGTGDAHPLVHHDGVIDDIKPSQVVSLSILEIEAVLVVEQEIILNHVAVETVGISVRKDCDSCIRVGTNGIIEDHGIVAGLRVDHDAGIEAADHKPFNVSEVLLNIEAGTAGCQIADEGCLSISSPDEFEPFRG